MKGCSQHHCVTLYWDFKPRRVVEPKPDGNRAQRRAFKVQQEKLKDRERPKDEPAGTSS